MPKGIAITTGLDAVNPAYYGGWSGELNACETDANDMAETAMPKGSGEKTLLTREATRKMALMELTKRATPVTSWLISPMKGGEHEQMCL